MSMTDKPKRKNLSPDELLQQANLLYRGNEAFVRSKSPKVYPESEIIANLYYQSGFSISSERLQNPRRNRFTEFFAIFFMSSVLLSVGLFGFMSFSAKLALEFQWVLLCPAITIMPVFLFMMFLGFAVMVNLWKIAVTSDKVIQKRISSLLQHGKLITGKRTPYGEGRLVISRFNTGKNECIDVSYISPKTGKLSRLTWYTTRYTGIQVDDTVILLYLNDDCVIVL